MPIRPGALIGLAVIAFAAAIGCAGGDRGGAEIRGCSLQELRESAGWYDLKAQEAVLDTVRPEELYAFAEEMRAARKPKSPVKPKSILALTGGGSYGAYPAGVLVGWSESGTRPEFDVVTGISTGGLIGCFAFLGPKYDPDLHRYYTCITNRDIYRKRRFPRNLLAESLADDAPLARLISDAITDERVQAMAAEHRKGRRFYVCTSDLDTRRGVVWDMGAIAERDTPGDRELIRNILLASASIPGFFPPVKIPVTVDGVRHVERHIDGVTNASMIFAPPWVPPEEREKLPPGWLYSSNLYILVAGKLYADPECVKARTVNIASQAVTTVLYEQTRSDLHRLFLLTILTGMNFKVSSVPGDLTMPSSATEFDPVQMTPLFEAGRAWGRDNRRWRETPPGYEGGEGTRYRAGTALTDTGVRGPAKPSSSGVPIPAIPKKD